MLVHWSQQGHKALVFTQTQQMLDIVERAVQAADYRFAGPQLESINVLIHTLKHCWKALAEGTQFARQWPELKGSGYCCQVPQSACTGAWPGSEG